MFLPSKPVERYTKADIIDLIENRVPESKKIDYKEIYSLDAEDKKREFLKDVTAFYNTEGGLLIYGLAEEKEGKSKTGIPKLPDKDGHTMKSYEDAKLTITSCLNSGTNPKLPPVSFSDLFDFDGKRVFVIDIPKNLNIPVMVTYSGTNTFHRRSNTSKYTMDTQELYRAFLSHQDLRLEVEKLIAVRRSLIYEPFSQNLSGKPTIMVNLVHLDYMDRIALNGFTSESCREYALMQFPGLDGDSKQYCYSFDGLYILYKTSPTVTHTNGRHTGYTLCFRNGNIETLSSEVFLKTQPGERPVLEADKLTYYIDKLVDKAIEYYTFYNLAPSFYISIAFQNINRGYIRYSSSPMGEFVSEDVQLPIVMIPGKEEKVAALQLLFDILWQSAGNQSCPDSLKQIFKS